MTIMLIKEIRSITGGKSMKKVICCIEDQKQLQNMKQWEEKVPQAVGQRQQPAGSTGWVEEHLAAFPRSLGSLDFPIKGSHLLENPWATTALRASRRT